jgi:two-component system, NarL family, response regulator DegU
MKIANEIKVFIADDHPVFLSGLRMLIDGDQKLKIIGEADNGEKALSEIQRLQPDVAVLDLSMPEKNAIEVARELRRLNSKTEIVILTMHDEEATLNSALELGVKGYILKDSAIDEIADGIKTVYRGRNFVSPKMSGYLISRNNEYRAKESNTLRINLLTATELKVLRLISAQKTTLEIAEELFISRRTVDNHRYNICKKLNIRGVNSLLKFAISNKTA